MNKKKKEKKCKVCKKRPVWRRKKSIVLDVCKRCHHKDWRKRKEAIRKENNSVILFDIFFCINCSGECNRLMFDDEEELCCICRNDHQVCELCRYKPEYLES